ncbi:type 1 glutamine amidotransferase domain-containing protein [Desulfitobacterium chlororespirans]|uniref:Protease I n=1 Tax=Desulfitobacterium chlororespirans DSM 11544 TaxID=1121395 RepID=A0A1M7UXB7_9FIRM|nr:type 1 glutamine amidotransferase domain-containing protein [Desulfitobacterium chlororespirans]SHN87619.1 protease I [Desulfitobacterium chlororespirans DSM 11544]
MTKKIALFVEDNYNEIEFWYPYYRMKEEGFEVIVIGSGRTDTFKSKLGTVTKGVYPKDIHTGDLDAVIIPGGYAPDRMRVSKDMLRIVKEMFSSGKVVAAICHAGWVLASAGILQGKKVTACEMIKDDLVNAGAEFLDCEVIVDRNLVTSRVPDDVPAFSREILKLLNR